MSAVMLTLVPWTGSYVRGGAYCTMWVHDAVAHVMPCPSDGSCWLEDWQTCKALVVSYG